MPTFLITGASSGIGAATARRAAEAGYDLVLAARSREKLDRLVEEIGPQRALAVACDVSSLEDQQAMLHAALQRYGRLDVVFANAGIGSTGAGIEHGDPDNWRDMLMVNVYGCALTAKVCLPELRKSEGHILLTGSQAGRRPLSGSMYGATKWAVTGLGYNLREELSGTGVRMTLVEPGMVDTPFFDEAKPHALRPDDIAGAVMYAVSQPRHVNVAEMLVVPTPEKSEA